MSDITVAAPPTTEEVAQTLLASQASQSGVLTDYNIGSQIRTLAESLGSVQEISGISNVTLALQVIAYSAMTLFGITPNAAVPASGALTFATALTNPPPANNAIFIPQGTLTQSLGGIQFQTSVAGSIASGATGVVLPIIAVNGGFNSNVPASAITQLISSLVYPVAVYNLAATSGGIDAETPAQALSRLAAKFLSLIGGSPTSVANSAIGVTASGTGETVVYSTCYDDQTEVLTDKGWFLFADLPEECRFATLNPDTHYMEYQEASARQILPYVGELITIKTKFLDLAVTPDHRMYTRPYLNAAWRFTKADSLPTRSQFKRDCLWKGHETRFAEVGTHKIDIDTWVEFLGYYIAEGCVGKYQTPYKKAHPRGLYKIGDFSKSNRVQICQRNPEGRRIIKACLDKLPFRIFEAEAGFHIESKALCELLSPLGVSHTKRIPEWVKQLPSKQLNILLDALTMGDGFDGRDGSHGKHVEWIYYTSSQKLADDVQEIALKAGYASNLKIEDRIGNAVVIKGRGQTGVVNHLRYAVSIHSQNKTVGFRGRKHHKLVDHRERIRYSGKVYCVTVPNHIIYVRRNGKACWNGQCYEGWADPNSPNFPNTPGFVAFVDNGNGAASSALLAAVDAKLNGNINTDTPGFHPAGMPYGVSGVVTVGATVIISGALGPLSNEPQLQSAIGAAVSGYFTLPFNTPALQGSIAAAVANAALGQLTSLTTTLSYSSASAVSVMMVSGAPYTRVILTGLSLFLAPYSQQ